METANTAPRPEENETEFRFQRLLRSLYKNAVLYREEDEELWKDYRRFAARVEAHLAPLGLTPRLDEGENCIYIDTAPRQESRFGELQPVAAKAAFGFNASLLIILLASRLNEHLSAAGGRLVLSFRDILEMYASVKKRGTDEAKFENEVRAALNKIEEFGFVRKLDRSRTADWRNVKYEALRSLRIYVNVKALEQLNSTLDDWLESCREGAAERGARAGEAAESLSEEDVEEGGED